MPDDDARALLRHTVATLAYRGGKVLRGCPPGFAQFQAGDSTRTPIQILGHIGDLLDWAISMCVGESVWADAETRGWDEQVDRFFTCLAQLDRTLSADRPLAHPGARIFQGPIADALAHVGQLAMLRRLAGAPVRGENYFRAGITTGRVGPDQPPPVREFD
jgi:hypothetical protein